MKTSQVFTLSLQTLNIDNLESLSQLHTDPMISTESERWDTFAGIMKTIWNFIKLALAKLKELIGRIIVGWRYRATKLKKLVNNMYRSESLIRNVIIHTDICSNATLHNSSGVIYPNPMIQLEDYSKALIAFKIKLQGELNKPNLNNVGIDWNACVKSLCIPGIWNNRVIAYGSNLSMVVEHKILKPQEIKFEMVQSKTENMYQTPILPKNVCLQICDNVYRVDANFNKFIDKTLTELEKISTTLVDNNIGHIQAEEIKYFVSKLYPLYTKSMKDYTTGALDLVEAMCNIIKILPTSRSDNELHIRYRYKDRVPKVIS